MSQSEVTSRRLILNTIINGAASSSTAVITALITPLLLHRLGAAQYGVWLLAVGMTFTNGYLALADLGFPEAAVKYIAEARAKQELTVVDEIASTTLATFAVIGALTGVSLAALAPLVVDVLNVSPGLADDATLVFAVMALEICLSLPAAGLFAVVEGSQRYPLLRSIDVGARVSWGAAVVIAVLLGHGVVSLAILSLAHAAVRLVAAYFAAHRAQPGLRLSLRSVTRATLRTIVSYGSFIGGLRFLSVIYGQMDRVIIGAMLTVVAVAHYEVAFRVSSIATLVLAMTASTVLPAAAFIAVRDESTKQRELYLRGTKYAVALVVPVALGGVMYARQLILAWVGPLYVDMTLPAQLFLIVPLFAGTNQLGVTMLLGLGKAQRVLALQAVSVIVNLMLSVALAREWGVKGVVVGTVVGQGLVWGPYLRLLLRTFDVTLREWGQRIVLPNLPGAAAQLALGALAWEWARRMTQPAAVIAIYFGSVGTSLAIFALVGLSSTERRHLLSRVVPRVGADT